MITTWYRNGHPCSERGDRKGLFHLLQEVVGKNATREDVMAKTDEIMEYFDSLVLIMFKIILRKYMYI